MTYYKRSFKFKSHIRNELTSRLANLQKKLEKNAVHEVTKDVGKIQELIKANLQRSKVIQVKINIKAKPFV